MVLFKKKKKNHIKNPIQWRNLFLLSFVFYRICNHTGFMNLS